VHLDLAERRNGYKLCQWDVREPPPAQAEAAPGGEDAGEQAEAIDAGDVPLPRPRPLAANLANGKAKKSDSR
jgi:hypothetical protein